MNESNPIRNIAKKATQVMLARVVFTTFLLGSTIYAHWRQKESIDALIVLYYLVAFIFILSLFYGVLSKRVRRLALFTAIQFAIDSFVVTLIVFITGGYYSFFTFLYLVVIVYASMILFLRGGMFVAALSSILYAGLMSLEYAGLLPSLGEFTIQTGQAITLYSMIYRVIIISIACFSVAALSGLLTEQNRKSQNELRAMESNLKRVEKMAYMGEMAAGLAHEIKNPLASLVGSIQMLKEDLRYAPDHERLMEIILRETDRLSTLVNDFLFFARPPAGKPEKINLEAAINEITELFGKDAIHGKKLNLNTDLPKDVWIVMDSTHLSQVMWNLLLNAAEAINDDGAIVIEAVSIKGNQVSISVKDNGCGMAPDVVQSIFDPFYTTKAAGTGLGLSIVHRILSSYDSRLDVKSQIDAGSTFSFSIPQTA